MVGNGQFIPILEANKAQLNTSQVMNLPSSVFYSLLSETPAALERVMDECPQSLSQLSKRQPLMPLLAMIHKFAGVEALADYLVKEGVDLNQLNSEGDSALHLCVLHNNLFLLRYLLKKGAKTEMLNLQNKTAYQVGVSSSIHSSLRN